MRERDSRLPSQRPSARDEFVVYDERTSYPEVDLARDRYVFSALSVFFVTAWL